MKLNEFKKPKKVDEGFWDALIGGKAAATVKTMGTGKTANQQMTLDIFLKDFVSDALVALETGVEGGTINPKASPSQVDPNSVQPDQGQPGSQPAQPAQPAQGAKPAQPAKPTQPAATNAQKQTTQNMNAYVKNAAKTLNATTDKNQKIAMTKELVNYMADRKGYPEWQNGLGTVQQVIKRAGLDPKFTQSAIQRVQSGQQMTEAWKIYYINKLLEAVDLTWEELGLVVLQESKKKYIIAESKYYVLNNLFESILSEAVSVGDFMKNWFAKYMGDIDYSAYQDDINKLLMSIEQNYPKVRPQLVQLGKMVYSISKQAGVGSTALNPSDKSNSPGQGAGSVTTQPTGSGTKALDAKEIENQVLNLQKTNPNAFKQLQQKMGTLK